MCCMEVLTLHFLFQERDAHRMYIELDEKKKPFTLMHCYIEFEKYPKWQTRPLPQKKQKKTSDASPGTTSNDEDFGACTDALEEELRPPGTKHDKNERLRKGKTSESNDSGCKLSLESVWAQKIKKDDIKEATTRELLNCKRSRLHCKRRRMHGNSLN